MEKMTMKSLNEKIEALQAKVLELENKLEEVKPRDRGPESTRKMTEEDAKRIMLGDLKNASHKEAAQELGLSYSQVYSCRGGYTFRNVMEQKLNGK